MMDQAIHNKIVSFICGIEMRWSQEIGQLVKVYSTG